ncbi:hypothetical protein V6N13_023891 [Hibiscus sabdariffa]|uniref:Uncharacterized protein n=1 Tax=Hibiscus sabdariffa TaxID=183260 RepID=A0ABR2PN27_9ROSI
MQFSIFQQPSSQNQTPQGSEKRKSQNLFVDFTLIPSKKRTWDSSLFLSEITDLPDPISPSLNFGNTEH